MLLYFGPELLMPVVSAVTAALGAILIGGKRLLAWIRSGLRWIGGLVGLPRRAGPDGATGRGERAEETESPTGEGAPDAPGSATDRGGDR